MSRQRHSSVQGDRLRAKCQGSEGKLCNAMQLVLARGQRTMSRRPCVLPATSVPQAQRPEAEVHHGAWLGSSTTGAEQGLPAARQCRAQLLAWA